MAKKETNIDALIIQNPELKQSLLSFQALKNQLSAEAQKLDLVEIKDDTSLTVLEQGMSKLKDLTDAVEDERVKLKAPYWDKCTAIDSAAKYVNTGPLESIKKAKEKKLKWIQFHAKCKDNYDDFITRTHIAIANAETEEDLIKVERSFELAENSATYGNYYPLVIQLIKEYRNAIALKLSAIVLLENASPDEVEALEESMAEAQEKIQETVSVASTMTFTAKKTRMTWKFELATITKVPYEWLKLDEEAVKEWMNENKDNLKDGEIIKGVKFYQQQSVTV